jgi:hypothetical protein
MGFVRLAAGGTRSLPATPDSRPSSIACRDKAQNVRTRAQKEKQFEGPTVAALMEESIKMLSAFLFLKIFK